MDYGLDPLAARAAAGHVQMTAKARLGRWFAALPDRLRRNAPVAAIIGGSIGLWIWETANTYFGFSRWWPERGLFVLVAALGANALLTISWRNTAEKIRAKKIPALMWNAVLTTLLAVVVILGLFSNFVAETAVGTQEARELNDQRDQLRGAIARVEREILSIPIPMTMGSDQELLKERLAEAAGWNMANLDAAAPDPAPEGYTGPACFGDLKPRPRFLCNEAVAIRDTLRKGQEMIDIKKGKELELVGMREQLDKMQIAERGIQYERMASMTGGALSAETISDWLLLLVSIILLLVNCHFIDQLLERREKKEA